MISEGRRKTNILFVMKRPGSQETEARPIDNKKSNLNHFLGQIVEEKNKQNKTLSGIKEQFQPVLSQQEVRNPPEYGIPDLYD